MTDTDLVTAGDSTENEKDALAAAAERALRAESAGLARTEFIEFYSTFMEDLFFEDWKGNRRVIAG